MTAEMRLQIFRPSVLDGGRWRGRAPCGGQYISADEGGREQETETSKWPYHLKGKKKPVLQRLRMSRSHTGKKHTAETREKIRQGVLRYYASKKPAEEAMPMEMGLPFKEGKGLSKRSLDYFVREKAILELSQLRREVAKWLDAWYAQHHHKPSLQDVAQHSPEVHNKFLRYIALQEFIRSNS